MTDKIGYKPSFIPSVRTPTGYKCPVCGETVTKKTYRGEHKGFKGAKYGMTVFDHPNKECVLQTAYYSDYFGKGAKTRVYKWTTKKSDIPKDSIRFIKKTVDNQTFTNLSKFIPKEVFIEILKADGVKITEINGRKYYDFDKILTKPILEKYFEVKEND